MINRDSVDIFALEADPLGKLAVHTQTDQPMVNVQVVEDFSELPEFGMVLLGRDYYWDAQKFGWTGNLMAAAHRLDTRYMPDGPWSTRMVALVRRSNLEHLGANVRSLICMYLRYSSHDRFDQLPWGAASGYEAAAWLRWCEKNRPSWDNSILRHFENQRRIRQSASQIVRISTSDVVSRSNLF